MPAQPISPFWILSPKFFHLIPWTLLSSHTAWLQSCQERTLYYPDTQHSIILKSPGSEARLPAVKHTCVFNSQQTHVGLIWLLVLSTITVVSLSLLNLTSSCSRTCLYITVWFSLNVISSNMIFPTFPVVIL